jgi:hypothetical protein
VTPWLSIATKLPVIYNTAQMPMQVPIKGAVLHTTNHTAGEGSLEGFRASWTAAQRQSAHFMVDRGGRIGQFRALNEVAWHINGPSTSYIGIEHIATPGQFLTPAQMNASADLLVALRRELDFPLQPLAGPGALGVGIHKQFAPTGCGGGVFTTGAGFAPTFTAILNAAILAGRWEVRTGSMTWIYVFDDTGNVEWQKLKVVDFAKDRGKGTYLQSDKLIIEWTDGSAEEWTSPLSMTGQGGRLTRQGFGDAPLTEAERRIQARRID